MPMVIPRCPTTFSMKHISKVSGPSVIKLHEKHHEVGRIKFFGLLDLNVTLVVMATESSHRLIMGGCFCQKREAFDQMWFRKSSVGPEVLGLIGPWPRGYKTFLCSTQLSMKF